MKRVLALALLLALSTVYADDEVSGWRVGAGVAFSDLSSDDNVFDDADAGVSLSVAYRINEWVGLEGAYLNTSDFDANLPNNNVPSEASVSYSGFSGAVLGYLPIPEDEIDVYLKLGLFDFDGDLSTNAGVNDSGHADGALVGAGGILHVSDNFGVKAEYNWYDIDDADLWSVILGLEYMF